MPTLSEFYQVEQKKGVHVGDMYGDVYGDSYLLGDNITEVLYSPESLQYNRCKKQRATRAYVLWLRVTLCKCFLPK